MMDFLEEVFPIPVSVGSTGGPGFSTDVEESQGGFEYRNINWSQSRHKYNVATGVADATDWAAVKSWFMRCMGRGVGFRFQDPADHSSAADSQGDPAATDQLIGIGNGSRTKFGLVKAYGTHSRDILKPVPGTVKVRVGATVLASNQFAVDTATGIVTLAAAPGAGIEVRAGFLFDVPCRFESDELTASWNDVTLLSGNVGIVELRLRRTV